MSTTISTRQPVGESGATGSIGRWFAVNVSYTLLVAVCLFVPAGTLRWTMAWVYLVLLVLIQAASALIMLRNNPALMVERSWIQKSSKGWDKVLALFVSYSPLGILFLAGLDVRSGWSQPFPGFLTIAASLILGISWLMYLWVLATNSFFSAFVRIQADRGHTVISTGPYRFVRHPGYAGAVLVNLATPIMLGSWWALTAAAVVVAAIIVRTALEDRTLQAELDGYADYARRVRFRLLPGIW